jgi:hypothetical protein
MSTFQKIQNDTNIQQTIKDTFDVELSMEGNWGYTKENASVIKSVQNEMPLNQLEHMITSMRAHIEMNLTQEENNRYGAINANERARETIHNDALVYDKVTYEITAIKEDLFKAFILEYKEGYEKESFDLSEHFSRRKSATLTREIVHYFEVSNIQ